MKLTVVLGASSEASFDILLNDNPFVRKWANELQWCLDNCHFNQQEAFSSLLTLEDAAQVLRNSCVVINSYLKDFIEIKDDIVNQPQEYFNYLHSKFETLGGKFGQPTKLFSIVGIELKTAIRDLNFFVHRVETKKKSTPRLYISFNKDQYRRLPLEELDYEYFEFELEPGTLFLNYVELGKDFIDLYKDGLELDYSGFSNLHYYSGEAQLAFKDTQALPPELVKWLTDRGVDPYDKRLGHGKIPLGKIIDLDDVGAKLRKYQHLNKILIDFN